MTEKPMKILHEEELIFNRDRKIEIELLYKCSGCFKMEKKLYQQKLCKACLSQAFKRLVKVIDSVRK